MEHSRTPAEPVASKDTYITRRVSLNEHALTRLWLAVVDKTEFLSRWKVPETVLDK